MTRRIEALPVRISVFVTTLAVALVCLGLVAHPAWAEVYTGEVNVADLKKGDALAKGAKLKAGNSAVTVKLAKDNHKVGSNVKTDADSTIPVSASASLEIGDKGAIKATTSGTETTYSPCYGSSHTDSTAWIVADDYKDSAVTLNGAERKEITVSTTEHGVVTVKSPSSSTAIAGDTVTLTVKPDSGYVLGTVTIKDANNKDVVLGANNTFVMPETAVTVSATFNAVRSVTVSVNSKAAGTASASAASGVAGDKITLTHTARDGYEFKGWTVVKGGVTVSNDSFTIGSEDVEVQATFAKIPGTVSEQASQDSSAPAVTASNLAGLGDAILTADDKAAQADGSNVVVTFEVASRSDNSVPSADKTALRAVAQEKDATVGAWMDISIYKKVGEKAKEKVTDTGSYKLSFTVVVPESMQGKGRTYYLIRYHDKAEVIAETTETTITAESSLFSTYLLAYSDPTKTVTVSFDANGGKGSMDKQNMVVDANTYEAKESLTLNENKFTRSGYIFTSWNTKKDGSGTRVKDKATLTKLSGDVTLYAQWVKRSQTGGAGSGSDAQGSKQSRKETPGTGKDKKGTPNTGDAATLAGAVALAVAGVAVAGAGMHRRQE